MALFDDLRDADEPAASTIAAFASAADDGDDDEQTADCVEAIDEQLVGVGDTPSTRSLRPGEAAFDDDEKRDDDEMCASAVSEVVDEAHGEIGESASCACWLLKRAAACRRRRRALSPRLPAVCTLIVAAARRVTRRDRRARRARTRADAALALLDERLHRRRRRCGRVRRDAKRHSRLLDHI